MDNYYKVLELPDFCTDQRKIRDAYRSQVKFFHPDAKNVTPEIAETKTKELNVAYNTLSDINKKQAYDNQLRFEQSRTQKFTSSQNSNPAYKDTYSRMKAHESSHASFSGGFGTDYRTNIKASANNAFNSYNKANYNSGNRKSRSLWWVWVLIFIVYIVASSGLDLINQSSKSNTSSTGTSDTKTTTVGLNPVSVKNGQFIVRPVDEAITYVQVKTSSNLNYYVYLKDLTHSGRNDTAVYIGGGNTVKIEIPAGKYELYYCIGDTWYGKEHKFGPKTTGKKFEEVFDCTERDGEVYYYEVTLYTVSNGNAETESVDMNDFPD